jgi:hypothetical protein
LVSSVFLSDSANLAFPPLFYWTSHLNRNHSCFVCERPWSQISTWKPAILTEVPPSRISHMASENIVQAHPSVSFSLHHLTIQYYRTHAAERV